MFSSYDSNTIYKDNANKKLTGVCAGIARHYDKEPWLIRCAALASLVLLPGATGVAYVVATILLRTR